MTIQQALQISTKKLKQKNISSASLDAEVLLLEALTRCGKNIDKSWLYVNSEYELDKKEEKLFLDFIKRRTKYEPIAYIMGKKEFYGYEFYVNKNTLIPRPETEFIIKKVLEITNAVEKKKETLALIDIGTGSGCIIISILNELIKIRKGETIKTAVANEISASAMKAAKKNAKKYKLEKKIIFIKGDMSKIFSRKALSDAKNIIITANLPYIKNAEFKTLSKDVRLYEPKIALMGGAEGINVIKKLIHELAGAQKLFLNKKIWIVLEISPRQAEDVKKNITNALKTDSIETAKDLAGKKRIITAMIMN